MSSSVPEPPRGHVVVLMRFGSHLYGTETPKSDTDWKGIYIPPMRDILLGRIPKSISRSTGDDHSKNTAADVDAEWYSLHYFLKLAADGQTVALDMLHAPDDWPTMDSDEWRELRAMRRTFHTKSLKAFVGYARQQAAKYGLKGSRLAAIHAAITSLEPRPADVRLRDLWDVLPVGEHARAFTDPEGRRYWEVCGRKLQDTVTVEQALDPLRLYAASYGSRAEQAKANAGIDWKAVSHALRAAYEVRAIFQHGDIEFPLPECDYLRAVKAGERDFTTDALPELERMLSALEVMSSESALPDAVDQQAVDDWLEGQLRAWI